MAKRLYTYDDIMNLPDFIRVELIDGVIHTDSPDHILPHLKPDIWHRTSFLYRWDILCTSLHF